MDSLTARQAEVLDFIRGFIRQHEYPPTLRDIAQHFRFKSTTAANDLVRALVRKGWLERDAKVTRGLRVLRGVK